MYNLNEKEEKAMNEYIGLCDKLINCYKDLFNFSEYLSKEFPDVSKDMQTMLEFQTYRLQKEIEGLEE